MSDLPPQVCEWFGMTNQQQLDHCARTMEWLHSGADYCEACGGDGYVEVGPNSPDPETEICESCDGTGVAA